MANTYCDFAPGHEWHGPYHEREYGFPLSDDAALFERLVLEINQAGLSWLTILKKRGAFRRAYHDFDPERVAAYGARDRRRLLADPVLFLLFDSVIKLVLIPPVVEALKWTTRFMELHRQHWKGWEGEVEVRQMFEPGDFPQGC